MRPAINQNDEGQRTKAVLPTGAYWPNNSTDEEGGANMRPAINQNDEGQRTKAVLPTGAYWPNNSTDEEGGANMRPAINQNDEGQRQYSPLEPTGQHLDRRRRRRYHAPAN